MQLSLTLKENIWKCNLTGEDILKIFLQNRFWTDVLIAWAEINYVAEPESKEITGQFIWYNSHIKQQGKPFLVKKAFLNGMTSIDCLLTPEGEQIMPESICAMYEIDILTYNTIWCAIPKQWKCSFINKYIDDNRMEYKVEQLSKSKNFVNRIYRELSQDKMLLHENYIKWQTKIQMRLSYREYLKLFKNVFQTTNHSKYRSFQFCLLHNALVFNDRLKLWKKVESEEYTYCPQKEDVVHFFTNCPKANNFWEDVGIWCETNFES